MKLTFDSCISKRTGQPLAAYEFKFEAESAAENASLFNETPLTYYECSRCNHWHLTPKDRYTPSQPCEFCVDSSGDTKESYETKTGAENRAAIIRREIGIHLRVYECPYQTGWHLTKQ
ncbi:hypothetical protein [Marinobacter sp. SS8-8]|uniref:hypothetical protein n=1 Tax=Marinobacter sp. SS8-8 TaxID=3050452 RepID=UPI0026DF548C|nr:hypothetical protein [Marinobacter sp. SS8-8]